MSDYYASSNLSRVGSSNAQVYFLRPGKNHMGSYARIHVDGQRIIELPRSACYRADVTPGSHTLVLDLKGGVGEHELTQNFSANTEHFFELKPRMSRAVGMGLFTWEQSFISTQNNS